MGIWVWLVATKALSNNRGQSLMGEVLKKIFSTKNAKFRQRKRQYVNYNFTYSGGQKKTALLKILYFLWENVSYVNK